MTAVAAMLALILAACSQPADIIVQQAAAPESEPPVVEAPVIAPDPVPAPAPGHIWILDASDSLLYDCEAGDWAGAYSQLLYAVRLTCDQHTVEWPADPWHYVEGGSA